MKRLLTLLLVALAAPLVEAGTPVNTILTDRVPPYLVPATGAPVEVGASATNTVFLSRGQGSSLLSLVSVLPGSDFQVTGGTCNPGTTTFTAPADGCTIDVRFGPTATGPRTGTLRIDCAPVVVVGGITINCEFDSPFVDLALNGIGSLRVPVPGLGRYEVTALALLLFALAVASLRRRG